MEITAKSGQGRLWSVCADSLPLMAQITQSERSNRIKQLLAELHKQPPKQHEAVSMPWPGGDGPLDVIRIGVDEVLLNPLSHRIRAQLEDDPEWAAVSDDPHGESAQRIVQRYVRDARDADQFVALKRSLVADGQDHPGVMTHEGLLINGNTRAVALREVDDPDRRYINVAVLPSTAKPDELAILELRLQMQKSHRVDYTMTNEMLFIEELNKRGMSAEHIARELRLADSPKKGENEVNLRLKLLDFMRELQHIPEKLLPLSFFDRNGVKVEQLKQVHRDYTSELENDALGARRYLESFLLSVAVGIRAVHDIRLIDADFMAEYMLPNLEEDEDVGRFAGALVCEPNGNAASARPSGVDSLLTDDEREAEVDVNRLISLTTERSKRVPVPGTDFTLEKDVVTDALKAAIASGIRAKKQEQKEETQLSSPAASVKQAIRMVGRAKEEFLAVHRDPDFDDQRRKTLEAAFKKLSRSCRDLEQTLAKDGVIEK